MQTTLRSLAVLLSVMLGPVRLIAQQLRLAVGAGLLVVDKGPSGLLQSRGVTAFVSITSTRLPLILETSLQHAPKTTDILFSPCPPPPGGLQLAFPRAYHGPHLRSSPSGKATGTQLHLAAPRWPGSSLASRTRVRVAANDKRRTSRGQRTRRAGSIRVGSLRRLLSALSRKSLSQVVSSTYGRMAVLNAGCQSRCLTRACCGRPRSRLNAFGADAAAAEAQSR
jgi:hypothetical protein